MLQRETYQKKIPSIAVIAIVWELEMLLNFGLAKCSFRMLWKNLNEPFGQLNVFLVLFYTS